jgi:hypothetical protein
MVEKVPPASCWQIEVQAEFCQQDAGGTLRRLGRTNQLF